MHDARVLIVDDSAAMRALFCDILERSRGIRVVGTAANAADARDQIQKLDPNVLTLDIEMPGISGIEFLEEIMTNRPMPVVMLSTLTQAGAEMSLKAYRIGAVECFPKPLHVSPEQFNKTVSKLGKIVLAAANSNIRARKRPRVRSCQTEGFAWNGRFLAMSAAMGGVDALTDLLGDFPAQCPPTIIVLQIAPALAAAFIAQLDQAVACSVKLATDGVDFSPGNVYIACDPDCHVIFEPGPPARLRLIEGDPIQGSRPSATLLYGTIARAGVAAAGAVLTGNGTDGARGLKMMRDAGCDTFAQDRATATMGEAAAAAIGIGAVVTELPLRRLGAAMLACCRSDRQQSA